MRMMAFGVLATLTLLTVPAHAQSASPAASGDCIAQQSALEKEMASAQSKGQMLRRRQLADTLAQLQERCAKAAPSVSRADAILKLEQEISALQTALENAQSQLRQLKAATP